MNRLKNITENTLALYCVIKKKFVQQIRFLFQTVTSKWEDQEANMSQQSMNRTMNQHTRGLSLLKMVHVYYKSEINRKLRAVLGKKGDIPLKN